MLVLVLAGTALAVDAGAGAAFDAPKRLIALCGTALAAAAALAVGRRRPDAAPAGLALREGPASRRAALFLTGAALLIALGAAVLSARQAVSLDAMRSIALYALLLPLGASEALAPGRRWLAGAFLAATGVNAVVSILQSRRLYQPFALETFGGRQGTGAFAGNVGYLAITLALAGVLAFGILLTARHAAARLAAGTGLVLFAIGLLVNQNVTALTAALAGAAVLLIARFRRRSVLAIAAAVLLGALAVAGYAPLRFRARELVRAVRVGDWDALVSFRGGPWAAAVEMTREKPLTGFGPGTFGAEYVPHRLAAEIRWRHRFVSPLLTSSYAEAHCDYLQVFCDAGAIAGALVLAAMACLLFAAGKAAWRSRDPEAIVLLAVLAAGAAAALTWFPLQRPVTAVPLLLTAGRAWKISARSGAGATP